VSQQTINVGTFDDDPSADTPRAGGQKINANFSDLYPRVVSVADYGAKGDGATDDSQAFTTAIADLGTTGGTLRVLPTTNGYVLANTVTLVPHVRILGGMVGTDDVSLLLCTGGAKTAFNFTGTTESESLNVTLERLDLKSNQAGTGIGVRLRNFSGFQLVNCTLDYFSVGLWVDWGQVVWLQNNTIRFCTRGLQVGGDISQTITPVPGAGIRGGSYAPNFCDDIHVVGGSFSQNQTDINHSGSQYALGGFWLVGNKFYESGASPVSGKTYYVHIAGLKNALITRNSFEVPNIRTTIAISNTGLDSDTPGPSYGIGIRNNSILQTATSASNIGIDVQRGQAFIDANTFECGGGSTPIQLEDTISPSFVGYNHFLTFSTGTSPTEGFTNPINVTGSPAVGHFGYTGTSTYTLPGKITLDDPTFPSLKLAAAGVLQAGLNTILIDQLRFFDSNGTVKFIHKMSGTTGQLVPPSTSYSIRNNGDTADNLLISDAGHSTFRLSAAVGTATIATSATVGFLYIPTMAATASGTPVSAGGLVALAFETGGNHLMVYTGGAWKQVGVS